MVSRLIPPGWSVLPLEEFLNLHIRVFELLTPHNGGYHCISHDSGHNFYMDLYLGAMDGFSYRSLFILTPSDFDFLYNHIYQYISLLDKQSEFILLKLNNNTGDLIQFYKLDYNPEIKTFL